MLPLDHFFTEHAYAVYFCVFLAIVLDTFYVLVSHGMVWYGIHHFNHHSCDKKSPVICCVFVYVLLQCSNDE